MTTAVPDGVAGTVPDEVARHLQSWDRMLRVWHLAFYLLMALTAGALVSQRLDLVLAGDPLALAALASLAVLVLAYATLGHRATSDHDGADVDTAGVVYLVVLISVTTFVSGADPLGTVMLFVAYSQIWLLAPDTRVGVWLSVLLTVLVTAALLLRLHGTGENLLATTFQMSLGLAFSLLMGLWLRTVISQGAERVYLLEDLQAAQAELGRTQHAAGVLAERERVSREIHDTLAQGFTSVVMLAQTAAADLDRGATGALAGRLALIEATARDNLAEARALVAASSPAPLHEATLSQALARLAASFTAESGVVLDTDIDDVALDSGAEVVLLRAAQESLSNVRRHARASHATLALHRGPQVATLTVHDDGVGLGESTPEGFGLRGMRERVSAYGGTVTVTRATDETPEGGGTQVRVVVPAGRPEDGARP